MAKSHFLELREEKIIKVFIFSLFVSFYCSCDPVDHRELKVRNNTKGNIYWLFSENGTFKRPYLRDDMDSIAIYKNGIISSFSPTWDERINRSTNKKLVLYIVMKDTVQKYGWEKTYELSKYYKKLIVDMNFLDRNNWQYELK